jgi:hypothetical protein
MPNREMFRRWPQQSRVACATAMTVGLLFMCQPGEAAPASRPSDQSTSSAEVDRVVTAAMKQAIRNLSRTLPCAAAALILSRPGSADASDGAVILDAVPSPELIELMLQQLESGREGRSYRNPYSGSPSVVEVRWWRKSLPDGGYTLTFDTQLLTRAGVPLMPHHLLEPVSVIQVTLNGLRIVLPATDKLAL